MPSSSPEGRGISFEDWPLLGTTPEFGSLTNYSDTDFRGANKREQRNNIRLDTLRETSLGMMEFHANKRGLSVLADEIGIGLYYESSGQLTVAGIDLVKYCDNFSEEEMEKMGGEALDEVLDKVVNANEQLAISFDFKSNTVAVVQIDRNTGKGPILSSGEGLNFTRSTLLTANYDEFKICVGFRVIDDVFRFGIFVLREEEDITLETKMLVTNILRDCNYKTFLESSSPDKYERLAKRIFLAS
ncbi:MAG: hypothetical protein WA052_04210 [Microgenomates group bacterium]